MPNNGGALLATTPPAKTTSLQTKNIAIARNTHTHAQKQKHNDAGNNPGNKRDYGNNGDELAIDAWQPVNTTANNVRVPLTYTDKRGVTCASRNIYACNRQCLSLAYGKNVNKT